jgi:DNA-binding CsgD family transcriptional regulator
MDVARHARSIQFKDREAAFVARVAEGETNIEIAEPCSFSPLTVKLHLARITIRTYSRGRAAISTHGLMSGELTLYFPPAQTG